MATVLGGIGLFLLGMILLTDGLKAAAGDALRSMLQRFTRGPWSALTTGIAVTALVQSSSATTLTTIGFVSAGLLSFHQAVGVIFGANVGTTSTSWLVSTLGLKVNVSVVAMPLVGLGALARTVGKGRFAAIGTALAGFGLIFVGIDVLQLGMQGLSKYIDPTSFPAGDLGGRMLLVLMGMVMTVVMQSSSAAAATTLTALSAGTIDLTQAAALVVGQNIGTTVTAGIASVGASVPAKRTALAHVLFNVLTGLVAFAVLPLFVLIVDTITERLGVSDDAVSLAAFHTAFNLLGVALLMPFSKRFSLLVERLVPERGSALTKHLDASVTRLPAVAIEAAQRSIRDIAEASFEIAARIGKDKKTAAELDEPREALAELQRFLASLSPEGELERDYARHVHVLHAVDHLERFVETLGETDNATLSVRDHDVAHLRTKLTAGLVIARRLLTHEHLPQEDAEALHAELEAMWKELASARKRGRVDLLERTARLRVTPEDALDRLESMRWVDRLGYHMYRALHHVLAARDDGASSAAITATADADAPAPSLSEPPPQSS
jgi:phosphate:Na+ symporter